MEIWPKRSTGLAKKSLKYMGPVGFWMWLHGVVFIDRSSHASALATVKEAAEHLRKENVNNIIHVLLVKYEYKLIILIPSP